MAAHDQIEGRQHATPDVDTHKPSAATAGHDDAAHLAAQCKGDPVAFAKLVAGLAPTLRGPVVTAAQQMFGNQFVMTAMTPKASEPAPTDSTKHGTTTTTTGTIGATGHAHAHAGKDGAELTAGGFVGGRGALTQSGSTTGKDGATYAHQREVHGSAGAEAGAGGQVSTTSIGADANAFVGAKGGGSVGGSRSQNGHEVGGNVGVDALVGVGGNAGVHMSNNKDGFTVGGNIGGALGIGASVGGELHIGGPHEDRGSSSNEGGSGASGNDVVTAVTDAAQGAADGAKDAGQTAVDNTQNAADQGAAAVRRWF